jgi:tetratricopeptide (TPR) repeat protein
MRCAAVGLLLLAAAATLAAQNPPPDDDPVVMRQRVASIIRQATRHYENGEYEAALYRLGVLPAGPAKEMEALNLRGAILTKMGNYEEALGIFSEVLKDKPGFFPAAFNAGEVEFLQGDYEAALLTFRGLLDREPRNELLRFKIVACELKLGKDEEARRTAAGLIPSGNTPAWYYAQVLFGRKSGDKATEKKHLRAAEAIYGVETCVLFDESLVDF